MPLPSCQRSLLEASGFAARGQGVALALDGEILLGGRIPITTMGGLKARGHPVGATGMYQIVEVATQLRGEAGQNQIPNARRDGPEYRWKRRDGCNNHTGTQYLVLRR